VTEGWLSITGSVAAGYPATQGGYARASYGNTDPGAPRARWLLVRSDGTVTAFAGKVEYGQNIRTGFAIEVAYELRLRPEQVDVVLGDTDATPWDMGTFGSQSTARVGLQLRRAAATARKALLELAAERLDLPAEELVAEGGRIHSRTQTGGGLSYGELVAGRKVEREVDDSAPLTDEAFTVLGPSVARLDAEARVTGQATYSYDVALPGMLFARILRPPSHETRLLSVDSSAAERMPGVTVVKEDDLVAVLAEDDARAGRAIGALQAKWEESASGSHQDLPRLLKEAAQDAQVVQESGDLEAGFRAADATLTATYFVPHVANLPMEPRAAVARWEDGRLEVWAGTQRPFGLRAELATYFGMPEDKVRVIAPDIGGGFGAKSYYPAGLEAARLAKAAGRPVRVAYTRQEDTLAGTFRPAALIQIRSGFRSDGTITAWQYDAFHAGPFAMMARRGSECPYDVPNLAVTVYSAKSLLRVGSYRSLGGAVNHFARESHIDEIAHTAGIDQVDLRLRNLSHPRFRRALAAAAERFGWGRARSPSDRGFGAAIGMDVGSYVGTCLEVEVNGRELKVRRVVTALDCGLTVDPEGARSQVEGSTVMGLGVALYEAIEFQDGRVLNPTFTRYRVPRTTDAPDVEALLVGDPETPSTGAGEPAIVTVAPAIANAVFDQTGQRIRELPLQPHLGLGSSH
jgi:isoquinoline 1-oxidoreductase